MSSADPRLARLERWADTAVARAPGKEAKAALLWLDSDNDELRAHSAALLAALDRAERCRVCGRPLEKEKSRLAGIGPDCAAKRTVEAERLAAAVVS